MEGRFILIKVADSHYSIRFNSEDEARQAFGDGKEYPGEVVCLYDLEKLKYVDILVESPYKLDKVIQTILEEKIRTFKSSFSK